MPIYEYFCNSCGHQLETLQKISEEPLVYCPECGQAELKRKVSAAGFRLKGSGWYETDFKNKDKDKTKKSEKKDGEPSDTKKGAEKKVEKPKAESGKAGGESKSSAASGG